MDPEPWIERLEPHASEGRRERAAHFRLRADALRCLGAEALLVHALNEIHGLAPGALEFNISRQGKPSLAGRPRLHFNLSHSGAWILCALGSHPIGVDVEEESRSMPAEAALTCEERTHFRSLAPDRARDFFFRAWTLKESLMKALGLGLGLDPVLLNLGFGVAGITASYDGKPLRNWVLWELPMPDGTKASCCCRAVAFREGGV